LILFLSMGVKDSSLGGHRALDGSPALARPSARWGAYMGSPCGGAPEERGCETIREHRGKADGFEKHAVGRGTPPNPRPVATIWRPVAAKLWEFGRPTLKEGCLKYRLNKIET